MQNQASRSWSWSERSREKYTQTCGESYKHFKLINYDSRVVPDWKKTNIMTLES